MRVRDSRREFMAAPDNRSHGFITGIKTSGTFGCIPGEQLLPEAIGVVAR
jgi:hypothetical protein